MKFIFPIAAVFIWAANAVVSKLATGVIEPGAIAFYRWFFAMLILLPFCIRSVLKQKKCRGRQLGQTSYPCITRNGVESVSCLLCCLYNERNQYRCFSIFNAIVWYFLISSFIGKSIEEESTNWSASVFFWTRLYAE